MYDFCAEAYKICKSRAAGCKAAEQLDAWDQVLGVLAGESARATDAEADGEVVPGWTREAIETLLDARATARKRKDFARADQIRDSLLENGIVVKDGPDGSRWHRRLD